MLNRLILTSLIFLSFSAFGQRSYLNLMNSKILLKNKVYKVYEYDSKDSLQFAKENPNGSYSVLNEDGEVVLSNSYSQRMDDNGVISYEESKIQYFYNSSGDCIGHAWLKVDSDEPVELIYLESTDPKTKKSNWIELNQDYLGSRISFNLNDELKKLDTISISPFHKRIYFSTDSISFEDIYLNKFSFIDSTIFVHKTYPFWKGTGPKDESRSRIKSIYVSKNGQNLKVKEEHAQEPYTSLNQIKEFHYKENGLLESVTNSSLKDGSVAIRKFVYIFRKE